MNRVSAHLVAALVLVSVGLLLGATTVAAKDVPSGRPGNPGQHNGEISNPGHHYGQFKHQPAPTPTPEPQPQPQPTQQPLTHPASSGGTHSVAAVSSPAISSPAAPAPTSGSSLDVPVVPPPVTRPSGNVAFGNPDAADALWWLVLLILPALLAIWVIAFGRITQRLTQRRRTAALAGAPAV